MPDISSASATFFPFFTKEETSALSEKYGRLCLAISDNLLNSREDAEECTNDAYLKVWNTIPPEKPDSLRAYLCRIVRNTALDRLKYRTRKKRSGNADALLSELDECIPDKKSVISDSVHIRDCLNTFLKGQKLVVMVAGTLRKNTDRNSVFYIFDSLENRFQSGLDIPPVQEQTVQVLHPVP